MVSLPTEMRGERQQILQIFSTVIVARSPTEAKTSPHTAFTITFYQLHAGKSNLISDKNLDKGSLLKLM